MELAMANQALQAEVAERARAEQALRETDRRKDEFLSTLAHELRNPLVPIRNALEIMRLSGNNPAVVESQPGHDRAADQADGPADRRPAGHGPDVPGHDPAQERASRDLHGSSLPPSRAAARSSTARAIA